MERWTDCVAVVTGASSGIGAALIKDLVQAGMIVVGLARRVEKVEAICSTLPKQLQPHLYPVKCDVSNVQMVNTTFDWIEEQLGRVDVLINNAGTLSFGQLLTMDLERMQQTMQTNVMGVVHCTQRAFSSMRKRDFAGHIVLVNSIIGHNIIAPEPGSLPQFNIYGPTKYAITALAEVLRQELRGFRTKIKVTSISPGLVDTEIVPTEFKGDLTILSAEEVSDTILYALSTPPNVQVHELTVRPLGEGF